MNSDTIVNVAGMRNSICKNGIVKLSFVIMVLFSIFSCSSTRKLPPNEKLYIGANIKIDDQHKTTKQKKALASELQNLVRPKPNTSLLGIRYKLMFYNLVDTVRSKKGIKYFIKHKLGEPPVLFSAVSVDANSKIICNRLENRGYFNSRCTAEIRDKKRKVKVIYKAVPGSQYAIRDVKFLIDSSYEAGDAVLKTKAETFLKSGDTYDLNVIKAERERIDLRLKENGFYFFSPDDILVLVDSTIGEHKVDLFVRIKSSVPEKAKLIYRIANTYVFPEFDIANDTIDISHAVKQNDFYIIDPEHKWKPLTFERIIHFHPDDIYNRIDQNVSLNSMASLGAFKFVKNKFEETGDSARLNVYYILTPYPKKSIRLELSGKKTDADFTGTELTINWRNRNSFRGAELLTVSAYGGADIQTGIKEGIANRSYFKLGAQISLSVPRFITPFKIGSTGPFVPKTRFTLGYDFLQRQNSYTLNSIRTVGGYNWKETISKEHQLNPIEVNYVHASSVTDVYRMLAETDATLKKAIEDQFTFGSTYHYTYTNTAQTNRINTFYYQGGLDLSGNILGLVTGADIKAGKGKTLFGTSFAQYIKIDNDFRYYLKLGANTKLANRVFAGYGYAYGNSVNLPFVKQFFIGGSNSIRAFRARTIGPGSYYAPDDPNTAKGFTADQSGDIKLEFNSEYRTKISGFINGAIFVDAGNIWLLHDDLDPAARKEGSLFTNHFLKDLLVGTGAGLRFDLSFVLLRFDLAFPLRKPWLPEGQRWVFNDLRFGSPGWRKENLVFHVAIGYPF